MKAKFLTISLELILSCLISIILCASGKGSEDMTKKTDVKGKSNSISQQEWVLKAELRGNENGGIYFRKNNSHLMHFILYSNTDNLKIYQEGSSWGYHTRSFTLADKYQKDIKYKIYRCSRAWLGNVPAVQNLNKGEFLITSINVCDGTWTVEPPFKLSNLDKNFYVSGHFEIPVNSSLSEAKTHGVWTGKIDTNTVEVAIDSHCMDILNKSRMPH